MANTKRKLIAMPSMVLAYIVSNLVIFTNHNILTSKATLIYMNNHAFELLALYFIFYYFVYLVLMQTKLDSNHKGTTALLVLIYSSTLIVGLHILANVLNIIFKVFNVPNVQIPILFTHMAYFIVLFSASVFFYNLIQFLTSSMVIGWIKKTFSRPDVQLGIVVSIFTTIITAVINFIK